MVIFSRYLHVFKSSRCFVIFQDTCMNPQDTYNVFSWRYVMFSSHLPFFKTLMISRHMHYLFRTHIFIFKILTIKFQDGLSYFQDTYKFSRCSCFQDTCMFFQEIYNLSSRCFVTLQDICINFQDTYNFISRHYVIFSRHWPVFKTLMISRYMYQFSRHLKWYIKRLIYFSRHMHFVSRR